MTGVLDRLSLWDPFFDEQLASLSEKKKTRAEGTFKTKTFRRIMSTPYTVHVQVHQSIMHENKCKVLELKDYQLAL